ARLSEPDLIAVGECLLVRPLAVHERAEAGLLVADDARASLDRDFGVHARDVRSGQTQIRFAPPADREQRFVDRHDAAAERVGDHEARGWGVWHGWVSI